MIAAAPRLNFLPMRWAPAEDCAPKFCAPGLPAASKIEHAKIADLSHAARSRHQLCPESLRRRPRS